jgi:glycosyltransferase involved in cell wall biosynthesis
MVRSFYELEQYIVQIARFDPSKGIFDVLASYGEFRGLLAQSFPKVKAPKLLVCGHGSVDDPDGTIIYDGAVGWIRRNATAFADDICVMRLGPSDQLLNSLLSKASIVLQLSEVEGFEVKVSEAIHKGKPVIATKAGGIPLQVQDQLNGFLVDVGDTRLVAHHLLSLWTDANLYHRMSSYSLQHGSDEVSTVGQALNWFYLCSTLSRCIELKPNRKWIQDMARQELGQNYGKADGKLKRSANEDG